MKKTRRFQDGGIADENFTADQLKFLGGADRTDPYILDRMRSKFPDAKKSALKENLSGSEELRDETGKVSNIRRNTETGDLYSTEMPSISKEVKKTTVKNTPKPTQSKKADIDINEIPEKLRGPNYKVSDSVRLPNKPNIKPNLAKKMAENKSTSNTKLASGGKVSSASSRADGCAVRGKTRA